MASFNKAIEWMRKGIKVTRPAWDEESFWMLGKDETIMWNGKIIAHVHLNQIQAKDWKKFEKPKPEPLPLKKVVITLCKDCRKKLAKGLLGNGK